MSDEIERTLCQLPQVHVFKIPVRKSADGHRASDWPKDPTWTGKVKIVAKGRIAAIVLLDDKNQTFAVCQVTDDSAVERTLDSGRYYVLRITNAQGRHAFIGIAFNERNDAFDFNVALAEFKSELEREDQASKMAELPVGPMKDLSLKEGEKIKIKITTKKKSTDEDTDVLPKPTVFSGSKSGRTGGVLLPPPRSHEQPPPAAVGNASHKAVDDWAQDPDPFGSFSAAVSSTGKAAAVSSTDPFGAFGSSDPFASTDRSTDPFASGAVAVVSSRQPPAVSSQNVNLLDF